MSDGNAWPDGEQNVCSYIASIFHQRQSIERLLDWLRDSQTVCTDTNCYDDINGTPGTELGRRLEFPGHQDQESDGDQFAPLLWIFIGLFTLLAMNLSARRDPLGNLEKKNLSNGPNAFPGSRRPGDNNEDDDNHRPAV